MKRYFLEITYDGSSYHGWQLQKNAHSVQAEMDKAIETLSSAKIETTGCGRTDTGVHARQFYLHFDLKDDFYPDEWIYKLNRILPQDIAVYRLIPVHENAHARFDATLRTYQYFMHREKDPFLIDKSAFFHSEIDIGAMNKAAVLLLKHSDFTSFSKLHTDVKTNDCRITEAFWSKKGHQFVFTITADRFLRNMVRAVVGTLLEVGKGKISDEEFEQIIVRKNRGEAGDSVPACGLYLQKVLYPYIDPIER